MTVIQSRMIDGLRGERVRIKADLRGGQPVVKLDLLQPIASHAPDSLTVAGRTLVVPVESVADLSTLLLAAAREAVALSKEAQAPRRNARTTKAKAPTPPAGRPKWAEGGEF